LQHGNEKENEVFQFLIDEIDSIPELEALLLLWQSRPQTWTAPDLSGRLYIDAQRTREILFDLNRKQLATIEGGPQSYRYHSRSPEQDALMSGLEEVYRREIVRVSTLIHSKPSSAVRDFARAFRFTKEKE
jgi:hypothetical protein